MLISGPALIVLILVATLCGAIGKSREALGVACSHRPHSGFLVLCLAPGWLGRSDYRSRSSYTSMGVRSQYSGPLLAPRCSLEFVMSSLDRDH